MDPREHARSLRRRLNEPSLDIELAAAEALAVFQGLHGHGCIHQRWLNLELKGYGSVAQQMPLEAVLAASPRDIGDMRLVAHVSSYRQQSGQLVQNGVAAGQRMAHFFIEPLRLLVTESQKLREGASRDVRLRFAAVQAYPELVFAPDVFERILLGFRAALHLQLGEAG